MNEERRDDDARAEGAAAGARQVPPPLVTAAGYGWRLLVLAAVGYGLVWICTKLTIVVLPIIVALLLCALLHPVTAWLARRGLPRLAATWITLLLSMVVLGGVGTYIVIEANAQFPRLATEVQQTGREVQRWLVEGPLHLKTSQLQRYVDEGVKYLETRRGELATTAVQAGRLTVEILVAFIFMLFVLFFLLKDGRQIWDWLIGGLGSYRTRVDRAGRAAWRTLSQYVHGTVTVAAINAVVLAIVLAVLGVPLVAPLAVIIFLGSFIPIVGILVSGTLAVAVTFSAKGLWAAVIFLGILLVEQQIEGHLLQPLVVGRWVRLHPLGIIVALTVGGVLAGIPGAALAVPLAAVVYRAWPALRAAPGPAAPGPAPAAPAGTGHAPSDAEDKARTRDDPPGHGD
ncbi:AI-2E family transporter [Actinomadura keratinilytica]|uniref:AI-2E family transporter n=1 Tax=Actinomadura keratinilytica TaxID=547461 RepID=A0ABP7ZEI2_9ACTN